MKPDPNHPILADIGKWIGEEVEVSNDAESWQRHTLIGYVENCFAVKARLGNWMAWKFCRPVTRKRRVPTDADALKRPRCWVRDYPTVDWKPAILRGVDSRLSYSFFASCDNGTGGLYLFCEIED